MNKQEVKIDNSLKRMKTAKNLTEIKVPSGTVVVTLRFKKRSKLW